MEEKSIFFDLGYHPINNWLIRLRNDLKKFYTNIKYSIDKTSFSKIYKKNSTKILKDAISRINSFVPIPRTKIYFEDTHLVYAARGVIPLNKKSIIDFEIASSFFNFNYLSTLRGRSILRKIIYNKNIRLLIPYSKAAEKSLFAIIGYNKNIIDKTVVIHPPAPVVNQKLIRKNDDNVRILFIGKEFYRKGGLELIYAFRNIYKCLKDYKPILIIKTSKEDLPINIINKVNRETNNSIKLITYDLTKNEIYNMYKSSHIFVLPTYGDTYGYVLLEAMAFGLTIISTDIFAIPEIVKHGRNGFLIEGKKYFLLDENFLPRLEFIKNPSLRIKSFKVLKKDIVTNLEKTLKEVIIDDKLRYRIMKKNRHDTQKGKLSYSKASKKIIELLGKI